MTHAERLTSAADFRRTYSEGKRASSKAVTVYVRPTGMTAPARVGVTAARGFHGAVGRNRAKRRMREAVRIVRPEIRPGVDVVLVAAAAAVDVEFQDMVDSVRRALTTAGGHA